MNLKVTMLDTEVWYGGSVAEALHNPFTSDSVYDYDMSFGLNQTMPLFISTCGRYIWCERPMKVHMENGEITLCADGEIILVNSGSFSICSLSRPAAS